MRISWTPGPTLLMGIQSLAASPPEPCGAGIRSTVEHAPETRAHRRGQSRARTKACPPFDQYIRTCMTAQATVRLGGGPGSGPACMAHLGALWPDRT